MDNVRGILLALVCGTLWMGIACADDASAANAAKTLDKQLQQSYDSGQVRDRQNAGTTTKQDAAARAKDLQKKDVAEYKENMLNNLAAIKELEKRGEDDMKSQNYDDASFCFNSVSMATVPGSEDLAETARGHLQDLEDLAIKKWHEAEDADIARDYVKEADCCLYILKEFPRTKAKDKALAGITALRSRPEVSAFEEYRKAEDLEGKGQLIEAEKIYDALVNNPRYEHMVATLMAKRKLDGMNENEQTRAAKKAELDARAAKDAPGMLTTARNYRANNMPNEAVRKLQEIVDKFPGTAFAEQAAKQIAELK